MHYFSILTHFYKGGTITICFINVDTEPSRGWIIQPPKGRGRSAVEAALGISTFCGGHCQASSGLLTCLCHDPVSQSPSFWSLSRGSAWATGLLSVQCPECTSCRNSWHSGPEGSVPPPHTRAVNCAVHTHVKQWGPLPWERRLCQESFSGFRDVGSAWYGLNCVTPGVRVLKLNPQHLRTWLHWEIRSFKRWWN